jgi:hypothetical protein
MRDLRLLAFVAPVFFLPLACEDSSGSSSGATFNPEAGTFEAGPSPEAGPLPEAGTDSSPPAPLGVTVTVTDDALPKSNVRVILQDAAGLVTGEKATDATGKVTLPTAPSMVTVLVAHGTGIGATVSPVSFVGVADGDKLVVAATADVVVDPPILGSYSVSFVSGAFSANASPFNVTTGGGCFGNSQIVDTPAPVSLSASCLFSKNALLVESLTAGVLTGFGFVKDVGKPPAAGVLSVGPVAFAAPGTTTLAATNVPATNVYVSQSLYAIANGATFPMSYASATVDGSGRIYQTPTGFAEAYQSEISFEETNASSTSTRSFVRREPVPAGNVLTSVDYASALPRITDVPLTMATAARPEIVVTSAAPLGTADGGVATFHWSNPVTQTTGSWTVVFPASTTTIKLPALPADAATFEPAGDVAIDELVFLEATQLPGYKELKLLPIQPNFGVALVDARTALPLAGTVRVSRWVPGVP